MRRTVVGHQTQWAFNPALLEAPFGKHRRVDVAVVPLDVIILFRTLGTFLRGAC